MDFDKQFGNGSRVPIVTKGRGFTEKPVRSQAVPGRNTLSRDRVQKVTPRTKFVVTNTRVANRRNNSGMVVTRNAPNGRRNAIHTDNVGGRRVRLNFNRQANGRKNNNRNTNRAPRRGRNNRNHPATNEELDNQLQKYFLKDSEVAKQRLDSELDQYMLQRNQDATQAVENQMQQVPDVQAQQMQMQMQPQM